MGPSRLLTIAALLSLAGTDPALAQRPLAQNLPETHARARSERVSDVRYTLEFELGPDAAEYSGTVEVRFELDGADEPLTLDFDGGTIGELAVNGEAAAVDYNGYFLTLPGARLTEGENTVSIAFSRPYSSDGSGLYRFIDPEDGRAYLYTDFEPFDQNRLFPSFDQPDLKARYTTTVRAPADWHVIANTRETSVETEGDARVWQFPETLPISTYVYALHAGEYHVWESSAGEIPLRLFARETLVPYVHPEHWFVPTRQGFEFFEAYFETPYPFGKYDQVIVPHFNAGAMENVGAVTFSERYLRRGVVTRQNRRAITSVILHEMAHMWFGDLVTMDWWNGLWLNESFATVMSVLAMTEATEFTDEWQESFRDTVRAYQADERDTTHPIELPVPDTDSAFANFDRITYQKGSATLVQLMHLVGPENFRRGVAAYLKAHAYGNTRIDDFLGAISTAAETDLDEWARDWLLEPGANSVEVQYTCADGDIDSMNVLQSAPDEWPTLRTHRTQLGLYRFTTDGATIETLPLTYAGPETRVTDAIGRECADFVYANHGDWDYVRVRLDAETISLLDGLIGRIDDPFARLMLWQSVWDAVLEGRMPVTEYVAFALANVDAESDEGALRQIVSALSSSAAYAAEIVEDGRTRSRVQARIEDFLWERTSTAAPGSDLQLLFFDTFVSTAASAGAIDRLVAMLEGAGAVPAGIELDQDRRWSLVAAATAAGHPAADSLLEVEQARDASDVGRFRVLDDAADRPMQAVKQQTLDALLSADGVENLAEFRAMASGMYPRGQHELQAANVEAALEGLESLDSTRDAAFFGSYAGGLLGSVCDADYAAALDAAIERLEGVHPLLRRSLLDSRYETRRCLRMAETQSSAG